MGDIIGFSLNFFLNLMPEIRFMRRLYNFTFDTMRLLGRVGRHQKIGLDGGLGGTPAAVGWFVLSSMGDDF